MTEYIMTVEDFDAIYGGAPWGGMVYDYLSKADAPMLSTTAGNYYTRYAAQVWWQLNGEPNLFAVQRKESWPGESGWRVLRAHASVKGYALGENAAVPDTVMPTYDVVYQKPQTIYTPFDMSEIAAILSKGNEALAFEQLRQDMSKEHVLFASDQLGRNADTVYTSGFTPLQVIIGSNSALSALTAATTNKQDVYGIDRDGGAGWSDSVVLHNSGTVRNLSLDLVEDLEQQVALNTGDWSPEGKLWMTGYATFKKWGRLLSAEQRFGEAVFTTQEFNGVRAVAGREGGFRLNKFGEKPILVSQAVPTGKVTSGSPDIFLMDTRFLAMAVALPTVYREAGVNTGQEILLGRFGTEAGFRTVGDELCYFFGAQGRITDLA